MCNMLVAAIRRCPGGAYVKVPKAQSMPAVPEQTSMKNLATYFYSWPKHQSQFILYGPRRSFSTGAGKLPRNNVQPGAADVGSGSCGEDFAFQYGPKLDGPSMTRPPAERGNKAAAGGSKGAAKGGGAAASGPLGLAGVLRRFRKGEKLTMVTAYDFPSGRIARGAGVELVLVGDSIGNCRLGLPDTVGVTMDDMLRATTSVRRGIDAPPHAGMPPVSKPVLVGDMPFGSYLLEADALRNAAAFRVAGADMVKLEGGRNVVPLVRSMTNAGIAVMGHIGLEPQHALLQGGLKLQGTTAKSAMKIVNDAKELAEAGAVSIVLECVPSDVGLAVQLAVPGVPVIGIGAGGHTAGQVLVCDDLVGLHGSPPSFVKTYANLADDLAVAYASYVSEVRGGQFPAKEHSRKMKSEELHKLQELFPEMVPEEINDAATLLEALVSNADAKDSWNKSTMGLPTEHIKSNGANGGAFSVPPTRLNGHRLNGARALCQVASVRASEGEFQAQSLQGNSHTLKVLRSRGDVHSWRRESMVAGRRTAFVPTMGNLHEGHLELVDEAKKYADDVLVSIYVNPSQFAAHEDLDKYPRTLENDIKLLQERGVAAVFTPSLGDIYPEGSPGATLVVPSFVDGKSEAASRPHHFLGVATVCLKLFNICEPDVVVFGQKDAMQCTVISRMLKDLMLDHKIKLVVAPTSREADGVARSSRNSYLTPDMRRSAPAIFASLTSATGTDGATPASVRSAVREALEHAGMEVSYISVANPSDMSEKTDGEALADSIVSIACLLRDGDKESRLLDCVVVPALGGPQ